MLVVKPLVVRKQIVRLSRRGGRELSRRLSPKQGDLIDLFHELVYFTGVFPHANLTLHAPLMPSTRHMIGASQLRLMKPTAFLVNTARGPLVDEQALVEALQSGQIAGAGLDVFEIEPLPPDHALWQMENVIITPHTAAASPRIKQ